MKLSETARFWVDLATIVALGVALWMGHPVGVDETASSAPATMTTR